MKVVIVPSHRFYCKLCVAVVDDSGGFEDIGHYDTFTRAAGEAASVAKQRGIEFKVGRQ